jgi:hypothetical protein
MPLVFSTLMISKDSPMLVSCLAHSLLRNYFEWFVEQMDYSVALLMVAKFVLAQKDIMLAQTHLMAAQIQLLLAHKRLELFAHIN